MIRLLRGDCRETLATLEPGSVQATICSPPYWGLRSYGTPDLVWGGDAEHAHEWQSVQRLQRSGVNHDGGAGYREREDRKYIIRSNTCPCGAWLGSLGLEPTPELFVEHIVECFRAVKRVLRDDGCMFMNMGDSYAGSGKGPSGHNGIGDQMQRQGFQDARENGLLSNRAVSGLRTGAGPATAGYKAKDLLEVPSMVAQALRADGWYLRSRIPWLKRNAMPESVTDRPSTSVEYVFLLSKSNRYFYDSDAVRVAASGASHDQVHISAASKRGHLMNGGMPITGGGTARSTLGGASSMEAKETGRSRRNGDWFFESWQGLLLDEDDAPLALVVNPAPLKIAHYASFPPKLVEPMVKASSRPGDWVLDPFAGSGTTLMVADRLGRNAIGCELSSDYGEMAAERVVGDSPMFVDLESA